MSTVQTMSCNEMTQVLRLMVRSIQHISATTLPNPSLAPQLHRMRALNTKIFARTSSSLPQQQQPRITAEADLESWIDSLTHLLTVIVPQLERLGTRLNSSVASSIGTTEEEVFWQLWQFLVAGCSASETAFVQQSAIVPLWMQSLHSSLYIGFHPLLAWLLSMSRTSAWQAMLHKDGKVQRNQELVIILTQPARCFMSISMLPLPNLISHFTPLPPTLMPLLCCIVTEQFCNAPLLITHTQPSDSGQVATSYMHSIVGKTLVCIPVHELMVMLAQSVTRLLIADDSKNTAPLSFLTHPAVIHCFKAISMLPGQARPAGSELLSTSILCLHSLLNISVFNTQLSGGKPLSVTDQTTNSDTLGLPLHLNPFLSSKSLEADVLLLHTLSISMDSNATPLSVRYMADIQGMVLSSWCIAGKLYPAPAAAVATMTRSVVGLAKHCTSYGLQLQLEHKTRQLNYVAGSQLTLFSKDSVYGYRSLLSVVTNFKIHAPSNSFHPRSGPDFEAMNAWCVLPGRAAAAEGLLRQGWGREDDLFEISSATLAASESISQLRGRGDVTTLAHSISLAATLRKLLRPHMLRETQHAVAQRHSVWRTNSAEKRRWLETNRQLLTDSMATNLLPLLLNSVINLDHWDEDILSSSNSSSSNSSSSCSVQKVGRKSKNAQQSVQHRETGLSSTTHAHAHAHALLDKQRSQENSAHVHLSRTTLVHQLQAITLLNLVQVSLWRLQCEGAGSTPAPGIPEWLATLFRSTKYLYNPDLQLLLVPLLKEAFSSVPMPQPEVSVLLEKYAVNHFHGRLVPGCSHLGCTNLKGISEASLKTQLCSRCRKARYCCVECQQAAWHHGAHSAVCRK